MTTGHLELISNSLISFKMTITKNYTVPLGLKDGALVNIEIVEKI